MGSGSPDPSRSAPPGSSSPAGSGHDGSAWGSPRVYEEDLHTPHTYNTRRVSISDNNTSYNRYILHTLLILQPYSDSISVSETTVIKYMNDFFSCCLCL